MKISRALVAAVSGIGYPSLVAVVAAGALTFTTARVFAESAPPPPACDDPGFAECSGSTAMAQCKGCEHTTCACRNAHLCRSDAGTWEPTSALFCVPIATCEHPVFTDCAGKALGDWCAPYKACAPSEGCAVLDGGSWALKPTIHCTWSSGAGASPSGPSTLDAGDGKDAGKGDPGSAPAADVPASDGSGCALAGPPGASPWVLVSASFTIGLAFLWSLRRRSR